MEPTEIGLQIILFLTSMINIVAGLLIVIGMLHAIAKLIKVELSFNQKDVHHKLNLIRDVFGHRLALALEFFLAADLLHLIFTRTIDDLIQLGALVAVRIAVTYFLNREIDDIK